MQESCKICENTEENRLHRAREMMFGSREEFDYLECGRCGTIQLLNVPDLNKYYPPDYYSLDREPEIEIARKLHRRIASRLASKYLFTGAGELGRFIVKQWGDVRYHFPEWLKKSDLKIDFGSRILDYGCGTGTLLRVMRVFGFRNLTGADAFISSDILYPNGVTIYKRDLADLSPGYDLIMLHHSFEHLVDPETALREIRRLLKDDGICLIRMPVVNYAWEKYGVNWVQMDAPRHLFLYTEGGFRTLAEDNGYVVEKVVFDSEVFQFFASEQYARDIAMNEPRAFRGDFEGSIFTKAQFYQWQVQAAELNTTGRGDQACFYLKKNN